MMNYYGYGHYPMQPVSPFAGFGWILGIAFWIFLILFIVALVKWYAGSDNGKSDSEDEVSNRALDILKERYAKGEISGREFDKIKKEIA